MLVPDMKSYGSGLVDLRASMVSARFGTSAILVFRAWPCAFVMVSPTGQPAAGLVQPPSMLPSKVSQSSMSSLRRIRHCAVRFR